MARLHGKSPDRCRGNREASVRWASTGVKYTLVRLPELRRRAAPSLRQERQLPDADQPIREDNDAAGVERLGKLV